MIRRRLGDRRLGSAALLLLPLLAGHVALAVLLEPSRHPISDEISLLRLARFLLHGHYAVPSFGTRAFLWHGPGAPALLVAPVALKLPLVAVRLISALPLWVALVGFHHLLRRRLSGRAALGWALALGLYVPFLAVTRQIEKEPLTVLLVVLGMLTASRALERGRLGWAVATGLLLGAVAMTRLEYGSVAIALLAVSLLAWLANRRREVARTGVIIAGVAVLACVPWLVYTHARTGRTLYWGSAEGLSLYWMSPASQGGHGEWYPYRKVRQFGFLRPDRPFFASLAGLTPLQKDLRLRRQAEAGIRRDPVEYAGRIAENAGRLFFFFPTRRTKAAKVVVCVVFNGALLAGLALAMLRLWRRRRAGLPREVVPFAAFLALAVLVHLPVSANPRMLLPLVPLMVWLIAQAVSGTAPGGPDEPGAVHLESPAPAAPVRQRSLV